MGRAANNMAWAHFVKGIFFLQTSTTMGGRHTKLLLTFWCIFRPCALFFLFSSGALRPAWALKPHIGAGLVGNLIVSTWFRYFGTAFLGRGPRGLILIRA